MPNELYIVALVALLDAVDADRIPVCRVASVTPERVLQIFKGED